MDVMPVFITVVAVVLLIALLSWITMQGDRWAKPKPGPPDAPPQRTARPDR